MTGQTIAELYTDTPILNDDVIRGVASPLKPNAGFLNMSGNLFDSALMKTSAIDEGFRARYFSNAEEAFEGRVAVFDGPEDFHASIDDPALGLTDDSVLVMRGAGPKGYPGGAEVVNMRPPSYLIKKGVRALPCIGDGRQSGTSGSASILNASPEAADGGGLALLQDGDPIRIDLKQRRVDVLVDETELAARRTTLDAAGGYAQPESQSPWQEIFREKVRPFSEGMVFEGATEYRDITNRGLPRNNH